MRSRDARPTSRARLNLDYATIRAPIDGIVGAALVSEGALVVQNDTSNLATIQQLDPVYDDFTQSLSELNHLRRAFDSGDLERIAPMPPRSACWLTTLSIRPSANCCFPRPRSMPIPDR
jgi:multidrug efflux pump subunit AcrA (membrane-fusion protein)